jgi:hypothetical protein
MRSVDLAVYADTLALEAAALARRLERARTRLRQAALEHEARQALPSEVVERLEGMGLLGAVRERMETVEIAELTAALAALGRLQAWVEAQLAASRPAGERPRLTVAGDGDAAA